jgi:hypothetical protein
VLARDPAELKHQRLDRRQVERDRLVAQQWRAHPQLLGRALRCEVERSAGWQVAIDHAHDRALEPGGAAKRGLRLGQLLELLKSGSDLWADLLASSEEVHIANRYNVEKWIIIAASVPMNQWRQ